jgi:hypothetical protein
MTSRQMHDRRPLRLDLSDGNRAVGWIRGRTIGFRGFATESEAGAAAWVAHGTVARRLSRATGSKPIPGDVEPLAIGRLNGRDVILASGRPIATLLRPETGPPTGNGMFGFEIELPAPADELRMRSMAHLIYRTLRRSGVRWSAPVPDVTQVQGTTIPARRRRADSNLTHGGIAMYNPDRRPAMHAPIPANASLPPPATPMSATTFVSRFLLISIAVVGMIVLIVTAPLTVTVPLGFVFFAGLFGTLVLSALERRRQRRRVRRDGRPNDVSRSPGGPPRDIDRAGRIPSASAALAIFSITMLGIALLAPLPAGVVIAALGLGALFVLRVSAMVGGWAPRGSAWAGPRPGRVLRTAQ